MALSTTNYEWEGLVISPYAKIVIKTISDYMEGDVKKYQCSYIIKIYTTSEKIGEVATGSYIIYDVSETISYEDIYVDLKTRNEFNEWQDS